MSERLTRWISEQSERWSIAFGRGRADAQAGYPPTDTSAAYRLGYAKDRSNKCAEVKVNKPQPPPSDGKGPAIWDLVMADMRERDAIGHARYETRLRAHNGRDALTDAYQEALDLAVYLRQAIYERDGR